VTGCAGKVLGVIGKGVGGGRVRESEVANLELGGARVQKKVLHR
jgi:hypothetical protein